MQDFVHRKNVEHYRRLLDGDTLDDAGRASVRQLLVEEEAREQMPPRRPLNDD